MAGMLYFSWRTCPRNVVRTASRILARSQDKQVTFSMYNRSFNLPLNVWKSLHEVYFLFPFFQQFLLRLVVNDVFSKVLYLLVVYLILVCNVCFRSFVKITIIVAGLLKLIDLLLWARPFTGRDFHFILRVLQILFFSYKVIRI